MEDFYDTFMDTLESLKQGSSDLSTLLSTFNDEGTSNYLIVFMRLLTSLNIKAQHEFYQVVTTTTNKSARIFWFEQHLFSKGDFAVVEASKLNKSWFRSHLMGLKWLKNKKQGCLGFQFHLLMNGFYVHVWNLAFGIWNIPNATFSFLFSVSYCSSLMCPGCGA